jgi:hypothetical protein
MSLMDLNSDLSKYRSEVTSENKTTDYSSKATNSKNFATVQPISDDLIKKVPNIQKPKQTDVTKKLGSTNLDEIKKPNQQDIVSRLDRTKLDDIVKPESTGGNLEQMSTNLSADPVRTTIESVLVNSISQYSPQTAQIRSEGLGLAPLESIISKFSEIRRQPITSNFTDSDTQINRTNPGQNNTESDVQIERSVLSVDRQSTSPEIVKNSNEQVNNITNPDIVINRPALSIDRTDQSIANNEGLINITGNITNPDIQINRSQLSTDRTNQSAVIDQNLLSPINNIINPDISLLRRELSFDRTEQSPNIITDTVKTGLVVNPDIKIVRIESGTNHFEDESELNYDAPPIRFVATSRLDKLKPLQEVTSERYSQSSIHEKDNSEFNLDGITPTTPGGRYDKPVQSLFSIVGVQEVNNFTNIHALGFHANAQINDTKFIGNSQYVWTGLADSAPAVNFISDVNGYGFTKFAQPGITNYQANSSAFGFIKIPEVNFFDIQEGATNQGFKSFTEPFQTAYNVESSAFTWPGKKDSVPVVNYFDLTGQSTTDGFTAFHLQYDSKYIPDASSFAWPGTKDQSPEVNFFDTTVPKTTAGFHKFAVYQDSKYIPDISDYVWKGARVNAPAVNYLDLFGEKTTAGFQTFTGMWQSYYIKDSSIYDWDGFASQGVPEVNYFDLIGKYTTLGFHSFAQTFDSKYITDSSNFVWKGARSESPTVNYFDIANQNTSTGFHTFAQTYDSKYVAESSIYDWDGARVDAPVVNYFDLTGKNTTVGFHAFAELRDSKYVPESSDFDWNGLRDQAPAVNYFDLIKKNTTIGFHTFAQTYDTKYIHGSSTFDWDGTRDDAPAVNYFDLRSTNTKVGFHTFAQIYDSKYVEESSVFDWDGARSAAPSVNYFDLPSKFTTVGFHTFAQIYDSKYVKESSEFDWDGARSASPEVNYFDISGKFTSAGFHRLAELYDSKYVKESSQYDWDGSPEESPEVNYFDISGKFTTIGFHRKAKIYDSKYVKDSSEFTFIGKFPKLGVNYFDKEGKNQSGFTLNIQPKGSSKPPETEYFHESSFYTFIGNRPSEPANWFENTNASGFTQDIMPKGSSNPDTEYEHETSTYGFAGRRPGSGVNYFDLANKNQSGFTLDIMPKGAGNPETEYKTESSISPIGFGFAGKYPQPQNFFPDSNATGFTLNIFPKGGARPLVSEYQHETSNYTWDGSPQDAPTINAFDLNGFHSSDGFHSFAALYDSKFILVDKNNSSKHSSNFGWTGGRSSAKSVNYFGLNRLPVGKQYIDDIQQNNITQAGRGFDTFFTDKTQTNFESSYSVLSTENGPNKSSVIDIPVTNFFGFNSTVRSAFLAKMTQTDGTLYPIISPSLSANASAQDRGNVESRRASLELNRDRARFEAFAPLSLGKRPWANGNLYSTLDNQIPNIKTKAPAGSYIEPYEEGLRINTTDFGYLHDWAIKKASSFSKSPIDEQYEKYSLPDSAYNIDVASPQPFVVRGIQNTKVVDNESIQKFSEFGDLDVARIEGWLKTTKGVTWQQRQSMLYKMNPIVDYDPDDSTTQDSNFPINHVYNIGSLIDNVKNMGMFPKGDIIASHGSSQALNRYETTTIKMNPMNNDELVKIPRGNAPSDSNRYPYKYNRLIALLGELLPSNNKPLNTKVTDTPAAPTSTKILRLSAAGRGPNSYMGMGSTDINRASHPYLSYYRTDGVLANYPQTAQFQSFYAGSQTGEGDSVSNYAYGALLVKQNNETSNKFGGILTALSYLIDSGSKYENDTSTYSYENGVLNLQTNVQELIKQKEPFNPKYIPFSERVKRTKLGFVKGENIASVPPSNQKPADAPHKQFSTVAYNKLQKVKRGTAGRSHDFNDFRHDIENATNTDGNRGTVPAYFSTDPKVARYHEYNLEKNHGFGKQGEPGNQRNLPFKTNISYEKSPTGKYAIPREKGQGYKFRGDRINIIDFKRGVPGNDKIDSDFVYEMGKYANQNLNGTSDLVEFYFTTARIRGAEAAAIVFRATFDSITDNHKPSWSPVKYMGRADPVYTYDSYERDVSFGFTIHIGSRDEMKATWRKLNYLASWTAPEYIGNFIRGPLCRLNIGHLFRKTPGFINSLSYTFDNATGTWETAQMKEDWDLAGSSANASKPGVLQLPKTIQVSVGFTVIGVYRPQFNGTMYQLYDDDLAGTADGLIPKPDTVVNYFRTFDNVSITDPDAAEYTPIPAGVSNVNLISTTATTPPAPEDFSTDPVIGGIIASNAATNVTLTPYVAPPPAPATGSSTAGAVYGPALPGGGP